jgi:hypothetical protein
LRDNHRRTDGADDIREAGEGMASASAGTAPDAGDVRARLDERYGRRPARPGRRRALVAVLVLFVAAAAAWAVWAAVALSRSSLTWQDAGTDVVSPTAVQVSFAVRAAPGAHVVCAVRALDGTGAVVGWLDVPVIVPESGRATATATVPTSQPATRGGVSSCVPR